MLRVKPTELMKRVKAMNNTATRTRVFILMLLLALSVALGAMVWAQEAESPPSDGEAAEAGQDSEAEPEASVVQPEKEVVFVSVEPDVEVIPELASARKCFETYIAAMRDGNLVEAADCFDLSGVSMMIRNEAGQNRAEQLGLILDYSDPIDPETLPSDPVGGSVTLLEREEGSIVIGMSTDSAWRFTEATVKAIPEIYSAMELAGEFEVEDLAIPPEEKLSTGQTTTGLGIRQYLSAQWKQRGFLIENWQWIFLLVILFIGLLIDKYFPKIIGFLFSASIRRTFLKDRKEFLANIGRPFGFLVMSAFWWFMLSRSGLDESVLVVLLTATKFMTAFGIVWCAYRAVDVVSAFIEYNAEQTETKLDDQLAPFVRKTLKVIVTVFGVIFIASNIDIDITSLLAGLGIGGLAVALAAQDTLANLFGSITVLIDRPFQVGDWVVIGDIEGTVEELGFRSTRIRTFYNSVVTVPNSVLTKASVDNLGVRKFRRIKTMLSLTYSTPPEKIEAFCEGVRELIRTQPYTRKDYYHCYLNQFSGSSLDVLLYCFIITPEWSTELRERHRLFMGIIRLASDLGISFAFPTQTIHMTEEPGSEPVFPPSGTIAESMSRAAARAAKAAKQITVSELGGEGVVPEPVKFEVEPGVKTSYDGETGAADAGE